MGLPAAAAADVSPAGAGSSRTHLPGPRHTAARRGLSGPREVAANSRARTALGEPRDSGEETRGRRQPALARPSQCEWRLEEPGPQPNRAGRPWRLPFSTPTSSGASQGPALKRAGNLVYRPGSGALRAFVWKVSIPGCNVLLRGFQRGSLPDFATPRSRRTGLGGEGGGGAANTRTQTLTWSRAGRRKPEAERSRRSSFSRRSESRAPGSGLPALRLGGSFVALGGVPRFPP